MTRQLSLEIDDENKPTWGGARPGAGRPRNPDRTTGVIPHRAREEHVGRHPIHVTLRAREDVPSLRREAALRALHGCLRRATARGRRFVHFSLQVDHLHVVMEAGARDLVARAIKGFASVTARAFNRVFARSGQLWQDRYHRHDLRTPTEVHRALTYVLHNARKHARIAIDSLDPYSSAAWFEGWDEIGAKAAHALEAALARRGLTRCTATPKTFLLARGFLRVGPILFASNSDRRS
jgi:putative transposase